MKTDTHTPTSAPAHDRAGVGPTRTGGAPADGRRARACRCATLLVALLLIGRTPLRAAEPAPVPAPAPGPAEPAVGTREPVVSPDDAQLLRQAQDLAATRLPEAITLLRRPAAESAGAALPFALGCLLEQAGQWPDATAAYRQALARMKDFDRARANLAGALLQVGQYDDAIAELLCLLDGHWPDQGRTWTQLGHAYLATGRPVSAETAFRQAAARLPAERAPILGLGQALLDQGLAAAVRALASQGLRQHPNDRDLWRLLAHADLAAGATEDALVHLECMRRLGLADPTTLAALADLLTEHGLPDQAAALYRDLLASDGQALCGRAIRAAAELAKAGRADLATDLARAIRGAGLAATPQAAAGLDRLDARLAAARGDREAALALYRKLLAAAPLDADLLLATGQLLQEAGNLEDALVHYERAARADPACAARALVLQARIAVARHETDRAIALLEQSLRLDPQPPVERFLEQVRRSLE